MCVKKIRCLRQEIDFLPISQNGQQIFLDSVSEMSGFFELFIFLYGEPNFNYRRLIRGGISDLPDFYLVDSFNRLPMENIEDRRTSLMMGGPY